ncbi:hypothetical protein Naga_101768g2 [Nannochloropsis gaditana]|uniref:Uncharacterized protein n=1 Tax=Nannochloropsis gaditana TaxID=72520 RepID=W7TQK1_9STRA|nr:hypothetical protein Naga_101768g2 [Nannochloropsis gaditana]
MGWEGAVSWGKKEVNEHELGAQKPQSSQGEEPALGGQGNKSLAFLEESKTRNVGNAIHRVFLLKGGRGGPQARNEWREGGMKKP